MVEARARFSQVPVVNISAATENNTGQTTTISGWSVISDEVGITINSRSELEDLGTGRKFAVEGDVARRPDHAPVLIAASLRLISDMQ